MPATPSARRRQALCTAGLIGALSLSCGDGVGRPIRASAAVVPAGEGGSPDVPNNLFCMQAASWSAQAAAEEMRLFDSINALRSGSGNGCAGYSFGNAPPLTLAPALRCSARLHAADMSARSFFSQVNPDQVGPGERMTVAGFAHSAAAEDIASGDLGTLIISLPPVIFPGEPAGCALGDPNLRYVGVGRFGNFWVIDVANP